jgi:hypothetical protein|nr:MAG TPA: hypothetical protein [Caudoviricetes sp.]
MEKKLIEEWLKVDNGNGSGYGSGDGSGFGFGSGYGYGFGFGFGSGDGIGFGFGSGDGNGSGYGYGNGSGYGSGDGNGSGYGYGNGISKYNNHYVFIIDNISTIITSIHGNVAKGFILNKNLTLEKIFVAKGNNKFAHGKTLKEAVADLQEKIFDDLGIEEKIEMFNKQFNRFDKYIGEEFYKWHHILTGSCTAGRNNFVRENNLDLKKFYTVDEFIKITKDSYGGNIIKKLREEKKNND